jgi:hypothetical protein
MLIEIWIYETENCDIFMHFGEGLRAQGWWQKKCYTGSSFNNLLFANSFISSDRRDMRTWFFPDFIHSASCASAICTPYSFSSTFNLAIVSLAAGISVCRDADFPFGRSNTAMSYFPSNSPLRSCKYDDQNRKHTEYGYTSNDNNRPQAEPNHRSLV